MRTRLAPGAVLLLLFARAALAEPPPRAGYLGARLARPSGGREGALLEEVFPGTPAARAGLRAGDLVVRFAGAEVAGVADLAAGLREAGEGAQVELVVLRGEQRRSFAVTLGVHPSVLLEEPDRSPGLHEVRVERDLPYVLGDVTPHERHKLDLFLPEADGALPIVLWIHAGAWSYGDRSRETALALRFAERGVGFAPMSYRLSSRAWNEPDAPREGVKHPAHARDCAMAFAWLRKRFPGHPLFVAGHSCGAHLAALLGTDPRYLARHGLALDAIAGVVAIGGGYDLVRYHDILAHGIGEEPGLGKEKADAHLRWIFGDTKEDWIAASPATYLEGCETPMLIIAEKEASMRRYTQDFEDAVKAAGVASIRFRYTDRTHAQSTPLLSRKEPDPVRDEILAFLRERSVAR